MLPMKVLLRAAYQLRQSWQTTPNALRRQRRAAFEHLADKFNAFRHARRWLDRVTACKALSRLPGLHDEVLSHVKAIQEAARHARTLLEQPEPIVPDLATLMGELKQLQDEFETVDIDCTSKVIAATTEAIALNDVFLGKFRIELPWRRLGEEVGHECFDIVALDPHPASSDESVTHPHVSGEKLCAGDANQPIRKALEQGRLADAFCLIRGVLTHYNPKSPYVRLEVWDEDDGSGDSCHDCGCSISGDERSVCGTCANDYCDECISMCCVCSGARCQGCLNTCAACAQRCCGRCRKTSECSSRSYCTRCIRTCSACAAKVGIDELSEGTCPDCRSDPDDASASETVTPSSNPENPDDATPQPVVPAA